MTIHTVGDSHSWAGWDWNNIEHHHLGPILCYSFGREKLARCDISEFIKDGDTIIFCFGEIDCRCHIYKHVSETRSYKDIIDEIVENYFKAINANILICLSKNIRLKNVCVFNVVPPVQKHRAAIQTAGFPFLGTDEERKQYVLYFNERLREYAANYGFVFFDVYQYYADENGFINHLSDGSVHIGNGVHLADFINAHLL